MSTRLRIPDSIEAWCREVVRTLHLRQGRPEIPGSIQVGDTAKPHGLQLYLPFINGIS
jgi:hypothetical protein